MKLFFDESGYSGCIMPNRKQQLYNDGQRHFVLGGVFVSDIDDEKLLLNKYREFKRKFGFQGEIKGSDLMTQENNEALSYFIDKVFDNKHFYICNYDKIFYLATLVSLYFFGRAFQEEETLMFYQYASAISGEDEELFLKYCSAVQENTDESKMKFLQYLIDFPFEKLDRNEYNPYILFAKAMLAKKNYGNFPLVYEAYSCKNTVNFVNMTALGEILLCLKYQHNIDLNSVSVYHDDLKGYEEEYYQSFADSNIRIEFVDSKTNELVQLADNVCSIYRKCFEKSFQAFRAGTQWTDNIWFSENYSRIIHKVGMTHIKMVTPISDWTLAFAVADIFGTEHNLFQKNKDDFWEKFFYYKGFILNEISNIQVDLPL